MHFPPVCDIHLPTLCDECNWHPCSPLPSPPLGAPLLRIDWAPPTHPQHSRTCRSCSSNGPPSLSRSRTSRVATSATTYTHASSTYARGSLNGGGALSPGRPRAPLAPVVDSRVDSRSVPPRLAAAPSLGGGAAAAVAAAAAASILASIMACWTGRMAARSACASSMGPCSSGSSPACHASCSGSVGTAYSWPS